MDLGGLAGGFAFHAICMALGAFCIGKAAAGGAGVREPARVS
jgi:hypothetical protein